MKKYLFGFFLLLMCFFSTALADTQAISHYTLKNGLALYVKPDHRAPVVVSQVWYKVGSSYDPSGLTGISHMLEHMMFEGTPTYPSGKFAEIINAHGGSQNAFTSQDETVYFESLPAKYLSIALKLEADRMQNLDITEQRFEKEHKVVMEEQRMRVGNSPTMQTLQRLYAAAFIASPYHHLPIGWMDDIKQYNVAELKNWYHTWYVPNNAILVVVGDVDPKKVYQQAQQYFGDIPSRKITHPIPHASILPIGKRTVKVNVPAKVPMLMMAYNVPVIKTASEAWQPYALSVLDAVLSGGDSSLLQEGFVRKQGVAADVETNYSLYSRLNDVFQFIAVPAQGHKTKDIESAWSKQVLALQSQPVTETQLARAKAQLIAQHTYAEDSLFNQAQNIGALALIGLPVTNDDNYVKNIQAVTAEQIQAVAKTFLIDERLTVATLHPLPMSADDMKKQAQAEKMSHEALH